MSTYKEVLAAQREAKAQARLAKLAVLKQYEKDNYPNGRFVIVRPSKEDKYWAKDKYPCDTLLVHRIPNGEERGGYRKTCPTYGIRIKESGEYMPLVNRKNWKGEDMGYVTDECNSSKENQYNSLEKLVQAATKFKIQQPAIKAFIKLHNNKQPLEGEIEFTI